MINAIEFDEKRFWIVLFSIMARREAAREDAIAQQSTDEPPKQRKNGIGGGALVAEKPHDAI
jgi:hypothetical protein